MTLNGRGVTDTDLIELYCSYTLTISANRREYNGISVNLRHQELRGECSGQVELRC
jgi:hypothetical protein